MATTITHGFQKLRENLEITGLQASMVSTRQGNVRDAVKADSPQPPAWAFTKAKAGIDAGEATYRADS